MADLIEGYFSELKITPMALNKIYLLLFFLLILVETLIAIYLHDGIIRPFLGDTLATIALYFLLCSFLPFSSRSMIILALLISFGIEFLQYMHFLEWAGWQNIRILRIVLGSSSDFRDLLAYSLGAILVYFFEK